MDFYLKNASTINLDPRKIERAGIRIVDDVLLTMIQHIMIGSEWIVLDRQLSGINRDAVIVNARRVTTKLWRNMKKSL